MMESETLREEVLTRVQRLSVEDLKIVNAFVAFLEAGAKLKTEESSETEVSLTEVEQAVVESFKRSWLEAQNDQIRPIHELEWN
jgi:hypothetical protein